MIWSSRSTKPPAGNLSVPPRASLRNHPLLGKRVHLNAIEPADGPALWEAVESSREQLTQWLPWVPYNNSPATSQRYAEACAADWDSGRALRFGVRDNRSQQLIGVVSLDNCVHLHRNCDLGYWLHSAFTGLGLMHEAATLCLAFAFDDLALRRVRCAAATDNHRSLRVIGRLGFHFEGISRQAEFVGGRWVDHAVFSRLATDASR